MPPVARPKTPRRPVAGGPGVPAGGAAAPPADREVAIAVEAAVGEEVRAAPEAGFPSAPTLAQGETRAEWLAQLAAASTHGELAAVTAEEPGARDALLLYAQTARALHQLLEAVPLLDRAGRVGLGARVDRLAAWLTGERGAPASAAVALCRRLGAGLAAAPR